MRFEETERYAEIIHKFECKFGRTPKSLVYTEYSKSFFLAAGVLYRESLHNEAYILSSIGSGNLLGLNPCMGLDVNSALLSNINYEGFASFFSLRCGSSNYAQVFVSYYKPIW